jgi:hypothetical protein
VPDQNIGLDFGETAAMIARPIPLALLCGVIALSSGHAKEAGPQMVACHKEATQRYIADIVQVSPRQESFDGSQIIVTVFENVTQKYEEYLAECITRAQKKS